MTLALHPNNEMVAVAWIKAMLDITSVATTLPDKESWGEDGFVQVSNVGGESNIYVPMREPILSIDCWGWSANSAKPPWNQANNLAEAIRMASFDYDNAGRLLSLPGSYPDARVKSVYLTQEPRRVPDDAGSFAHYQFDMYCGWIEIPA